jgi:polyphenol oxidase
MMAANSFQLEDKTYLSVIGWDGLIKGLSVGFTTKNGGNSVDEFSSLNLGLHVNDQNEIVIKNRDILSKVLRVSLDNWVFAEQVHSNVIKKVTKESKGKGISVYEDGITGSDGIYTSEKGIMLSLCFADCVPLYFIAPEHSLIGLAHAGWKGTVKNIAGEMIIKWNKDEGVNLKDIKVAIGPAINDCCYIVDEKVISSIDKNILGVYPLPYSTVSEGQYKLNLPLLNKYYLLSAGIPEENIITSDLCTSCESELFFSHRRDKGKTGRMLSFIGINEEAHL